MTEEQIQIMCSDWMNIRYPELSKLYFFNSFQGMRLNFGQKKKKKKTGGLKTGLPDFMFLKNNGTYSSLFIELKKESPYLKIGIPNNQIRNDEHLQLQNDVIQQLKLEGHYACFAWSFDQFKKIVTDYMENKL